MKMVNIGCGKVFHEEWINLDLVSHSAGVQSWDLRKGLPFPPQSVDVCYSSHVLEHLSKAEADFSLREQFRILRPGGITRIAVPDLETICRNYLQYLEELCSGDLTHEFRYDYSLLEMFDQTTRTEPGGELRELWKSKDLQDRDFVIERSGLEFLAVLRQIPATKPSRIKTLASMVQSGEWQGIFRGGKHAFTHLFLRGILGRNGSKTYRELRFRQSGEIHKVLYDRFSLSRLLQRHGFSEPRVCAADESAIPAFSTYGLETHEGTVRKPDSLYMEALKPE